MAPEETIALDKRRALRRLDSKMPATAAESITNEQESCCTKWLLNIFYSSLFELVLLIVDFLLQNALICISIKYIVS